MSTGKYLWMAVTADEYELPLAVEDTAVKLGALLGLAKHTVSENISKGRTGKSNGYRFVKVRIDDYTETD